MLTQQLELKLLHLSLTLRQAHNVTKCLNHFSAIVSVKQPEEKTLRRMFQTGMFPCIRTYLAAVSTHRGLFCLHLGSYCTLKCMQGKKRTEKTPRPDGNTVHSIRDLKTFNI